MNYDIEVVSSFMVGANRLPPVAVFAKGDTEDPVGVIINGLMNAWDMYGQFSSRKDIDWQTMHDLLNQLKAFDASSLKPGFTTTFETVHDHTCYNLRIVVRKYQQDRKQQEKEKEGPIMGWLKEMLFGKEVIRRSPEDNHQHPDAKTDLDKPHYEPSYQRAFFDKLVSDWQLANGETNPADADVEAKVVVIGKAAYLLRGAAANTPDEVLWAFLSATWADCVHQQYSGSGHREKTLTPGIKVCQARDENGMYTRDKMVLAQFYPIGNDYRYSALLPSEGGHKEQERSVELDVKVGPMLMDRLSKLFSLGEVLCVSDRDVTNVNSLLALGYNVVSGPHDTTNQIFTRLSKVK